MDSEIIVQKEKTLVKAIYKLTLAERRLFDYAIAKVNPFKHSYGKYYFIELNKLFKYYSLTSNSLYSEYYSAVDKLFNRQCTYFSDTMHKPVTCRLIVDKVTDDSGIVGLRFSDQVAEMITADQDFIAYKLSKTVAITSPSANRIYEILLYSLQRCPVNKLTKNINISELKKTLGLDDKYQRFFHFKDRVLDTSKSQINKHTDVNIDYTIIKSGRTPTDIKFTARFKRNGKPQVIETPARENALQNVAQQNHIEESDPVSDDQRLKGKGHLANIRDQLKVGATV
jgi:plasmid replication initiation protein